MDQPQDGESSAAERSEESHASDVPDSRIVDFGILLAVVCCPLMLAALNYSAMIVDTVAGFGSVRGLIILSGNFLLTYLQSLLLIWIGLSTPALGGSRKSAAFRLVCLIIWCISTTINTLWIFYSLDSRLDLKVLFGVSLNAIFNLSGMLGCLMLAKRITGICLVKKTTDALPPRRPISIAHLLILTATVAVIAAVFRHANALSTPSSLGTTSITLMMIAFLLRWPLNACLTLALIYLKRRRCWWMCPLAVIVDAACKVGLAMIVMYAQEIPFVLPSVTNIAIQSTGYVLVVLFAIWTLERVGLRFATRRGATDYRLL